MVSMSAIAGSIYMENIMQKGIEKVLFETIPPKITNQQTYNCALTNYIHKYELIKPTKLFLLAQHVTPKTGNDIVYLQNESKALKRTIILLSIIFIIIILSMAMFIGFAYMSMHKRTREKTNAKPNTNLHQDFFSKMSDAFRTPLNMIIGLSENIENGKADTEEKMKKTVQIIKRNSYYIQRLSDQIIDLTKLYSNFNDMEWKRGDIIQYTKLIVDSFSDLAKQRNISLEYQHTMEEFVTAFVPDYYDKVLYNLISNSLKYTNGGGHIIVSTSFEDNNLIVKVSDTGIGIKKELLPHIFEDFHTSLQYHSNVGTGLGLVLVRSIVNVLNGNIKVDSEEGKGTTFTITTPIVENNDKLQYLSLKNEVYKPKDEDDIIMDTTTDDDPENKSKPKILIVEDNVDVIEHAIGILHQNYSIIYAKDGKDGLTKAKQQVPDLIISDLMMPNFDGYELCRQVRSSTLLSHIPFIMISSNTSEEARIKGLKFGADAYFSKPFNAEVLIVRISQLISQRKQLRELFSKNLIFKEKTSIENPLNKNDQEFLERVASIVRKQMLQGQVNVESISSQLCLSSKQLRRKLYALTGETTVAYIMQIRLAEAHKILINNPEMTIFNVALKCGFEDGGYFSKAFKQQYGITPTQLRQNNNCK